MEESALGCRAAGPRLAAWMVHHAAWVICACPVGTGGLTPFRRLKGRKFGTTARWVWSAGVAQRTAVGESEQVQSEMRRGKVAWVLPEVVSLHRGRL